MPEQAYRKDPKDGYVYEKITLPSEGKIAIIDDARLMDLPEYSSSIPTGVYVNKMWRCDGRPRLPNHANWWRVDETWPPVWLVCEYTPHPTNPSLCRIIKRVAASPEAMAAIAEGVLWWLG